MNHKVALTILAGVCLLLFTACLKEENANLTYLHTEYGGCNGRGESFILPKATFQNDTLYWKIDGDLLEIFIGINYICCAPFKIETSQSGAELTIMVRDTCADPYHSCYCRCICYYEFLSYFEGYTGGHYNLNVYLHNPCQPQDSLLWAVRIP